ncbi:MAG TPA: hypothetical protein VF414_00735 [Thermoanaerobaculia bacterium]
MNRKHFTSNAILWAAAILASALVGAPPVFTLVLLPSLATSALLATRPIRSGRPSGPC